VALRRSKETERTGTPSVLVLVGLANPGTDYEGSRHNVGGDAVRMLAAKRGATLKLESRQRAVSATFPTPRGPVTIAVPTTYMNESGAALPPLLKRAGLKDLSRLIVIHDELDLEPGRLQLKFGGGLAGHNGLRSIASALSTQDFGRLRIGIGRPATKEQVTDWVLRRPTGARKQELLANVQAACDALEQLVDYDFEDAQRRINAS